MSETQKINWREIAIFFIIAVAVSAPFRLRIIQPELFVPLPYGLNSLYSVLRGIGPMIGFVVVFFILKSNVKRTLDFWGMRKTSSILAAIVIPVGLTVIGVPNDNGLNDHYMGLITGCTLFLYSLGEEYGWRGYLQEALVPMKTPSKVFVIGTLWYVWHLNFLNPQISLQIHLIHYLSLLAGAWGLLKITEVSRSILFASAVHLSFNILADVPGSFEKRLMVLVLAIVVWIILLRLPRKQPAISD